MLVLYLFLMKLRAIKIHRYIIRVLVSILHGYKIQYLSSVSKEFEYTLSTKYHSEYGVHVRQRRNVSVYSPIRLLIFVLIKLKA